MSKTLQITFQFWKKKQTPFDFSKCIRKALSNLYRTTQVNLKFISYIVIKDGILLLSFLNNITVNFTILKLSTTVITSNTQTYNVNRIFIFFCNFTDFELVSVFLFSQRHGSMMKVNGRHSRICSVSWHTPEQEVEIFCAGWRVIRPKTDLSKKTHEFKNLRAGSRLCKFIGLSSSLKHTSFVYFDFFLYV